jgi:LPS-assembly protein
MKLSGWKIFPLIFPMILALISDSMVAPAQQGPRQSDSRAKAEFKSASGDLLEVVADRQSRDGDLFMAEGYVNATMGQMRLQADRVTLNEATSYMVADGNVVFDQGPDQRITARRAEINWESERGVFWDTTGFTNRTQTGDYLYFAADRVEKTGPDTYLLYNATVTACEDGVPKWSFSARRAELKRDDRMKLYGSVFRVKQLPVLPVPFAWIPINKRERQSGFLIPAIGSSSQKGRTLKLAYYQTLGQSADIIFRSDIYTARGLGFGAEFRAQTDQKSYLRLGVFAVKDRLFGMPGEDQGGTAFVGDLVQYLGAGWVAVGQISAVSSLKFRQVFSDDISQVIDPRRESTFYANNNAKGFSASFLASNETTTIFRPGSEPGGGTNFDVRIRRAPQFDLLVQPRQIWEKLPLHFSLQASVGAFARQESVEDRAVLLTPAAVERFDLRPEITVPGMTIAGIAITPSMALSQTFYTASINPSIPTFDPDRFTLDPGDPRLDPSRPEYKPGLKLLQAPLNRIVTENLSRFYAEMKVDLRPPSLERIFLGDDGSYKFKHLIEPQVTYRRIWGIGNEFDRIIRFDDRDAVANTNEIEYALVNRFFLRRSTAEVVRRRRRMRRARPNPEQQETNQDSYGGAVQAHEVLTVRIAQKYFFDRSFGGALVEGRRNQFYPLNMVSGFSLGGRARGLSPANLTVRYRPLSAMFADLRMDIGSGGVRDLVVSGGLSGQKLSASASWYLSRRIEGEAGTFPGNQLFVTFAFGQESKGFYAGTRVGYDFTDRFIGPGHLSSGRLQNTRSYFGYAWDCCSVQFNYNTFKAGLRSESSFSFSFTLAGIGSFGTEQFSQLGGGRGGRRRGRRSNREDL